MAHLPRLITVISELLRVERSLVDYHSRMLREAGLLSSAKRGAGAAHMTPRDAANLIITINTAEVARDAPLMVRLYRNLQSSKGQPFGDALEYLISNAPLYRDDAFRTIETVMGSEHREISKRASLLASTPGALRVSFYKPQPGAFIKEPLSGTLGATGTGYHPTADLTYEDVCKPTDDDRLIEVSFGLKTLLAVHEVLGTDEESAADEIETAA